MSRTAVPIVTIRSSDNARVRASRRFRRIRQIRRSCARKNRFRVGKLNCHRLVATRLKAQDASAALTARIQVRA